MWIERVAKGGETVSADDVFVHRVVLIKVTQPVEDEALYDVTRGYWRVGAIRRDGGPRSPEVALSVRRNTVVGAWWIDRWAPRADGRWAFEGHDDVALDALYLGRDVQDYFPHGAQNPLRYVVGGTASALAVSHAPSDGSTDYGELVEVLESEALGRIMFGSLELFHSNFLAWFFDAMPDVADQVFARWVGAGPGLERRVRREWQHLDLVMEWPGRGRLVIENKVKALPEQRQLRDYAGKLAGLRFIDGVPFFGADAEPTVSLVLLSMLPWTSGKVSTGFTDPAGHTLDWSPLSYGHLADELEAALEALAPSYEKETVARYVRVIRALHGIVAGVRVSGLDEDVDVPSEVASAVHGSTLASMLAKMRARTVAEALDAELQRRSVPGAVESDFSNGTGIVTWTSDVGVTGKLELGVQLQSGQLRRFAMLLGMAGKGAAAAERRGVAAWRHPELFSMDAVVAVLGDEDAAVMPLPVPGKPPLNHFAPDFVYRYLKVPRLSIGQLADVVERVANDLEGFQPTESDWGP